MHNPRQSFLCLACSINSVRGLLRPTEEVTRSSSSPILSCACGVLTQESSQLQLRKLTGLRSTSSQLPVITYTVTIHRDYTWVVIVHGNCLHVVADTPLSGIPCKPDSSSLQQLTSLLGESHICPGNPDEYYLTMATAHKGQLSSSGSVVARVEENLLVKIHGSMYNCTIQTASCVLLLGKDEMQCSSCKAYHCQLQAMHSRWLTMYCKISNHQSLSKHSTKSKEENTAETDIHY